MLLLLLPSQKASSQLKAVYNPKAVIPHAALLHQTSVHCAIFPTAASRRSLGRISVPMWPVALSGRLPVEALVSHYLTNKLIGRESIPNQKISFQPTRCLASSYPVLATVSDCYPRDEGRLLTCYSPVRHSCTPKKGLTVRLACVKHTASVRPEPGSNSPSKKSNTPTPTQKTQTQAHPKNSTQNPITDKPPQHTQTNAHTAEENQSKEKNKKQTKNKTSLIHPQKWH